MVEFDFKSIKGYKKIQGFRMLQRKWLKFINFTLEKIIHYFLTQCYSCHSCCT